MRDGTERMRIERTDQESREKHVGWILGNGA